MSRASVYQYPTNTGSQGSGSLQQQQQANANRSRQYSHLNAQLAQLNAHLADTENLLRMTAVQADYIRGLGGWCGGLYVQFEFACLCLVLCFDLMGIYPLGGRLKYLCLLATESRVFEL